MIYIDNAIQEWNFVVENQIQSTTHMSFKTVTKEQMTSDSNNTDNGKYV